MVAYIYHPPRRERLPAFPEDLILGRLRAARVGLLRFAGSRDPAEWAAAERLVDLATGELCRRMRDPASSSADLTLAESLLRLTLRAAAVASRGRAMIAIGAAP